MSDESPCSVSSVPTDDGLTTGNRVRVLATMYAGYAMFMVLRMAPTVAGTSITSDESLGVSTGDWARILAVGTIGAVIGKLIGGWAADKFGGRITFAVGLVLSSIGVAGFAWSSSVAMFQLTLFLTLLAKSSGWPSMTRIIVDNFRPQQYGRVWGVLSTSSRVGTLIATMLLGGLLTLLAWRSMLLAAAAMGILIGIGFFFALTTRRNERIADSMDDAAPEPEEPSSVPHALDGRPMLGVLSYFGRSGRFWLIVASLSALTVMWDFLMLVPQYMTDTFGMEPAAASMASSAFPFGSLISVLLGGFVFDKLSRRSTSWVMGVLLLVASGCIGGFLLMPQLQLSQDSASSLAMALLFVFGLCVSPCYYIPMSVFSIEFGGPRSGFLVALLDAVAFTINAAFYYFVGPLAEQSWPLFLSVLTGVSLASMATTFWFMLLESRFASVPADAT